MLSNGILGPVECPANGLNENGYASVCGMTETRAEIIEWQNQFDKMILPISKSKGIPAHLLKNLFAKESQFWPGDYGEV
ncbi:MAG: hypothetical protein N2D54_06660, partial [Chloroflexota bacterium]